MIAGIGADLVEIARIKRIYCRWGLKFAARFLSAKELAAIPESNPQFWLAGRFAAKEAAAKALGTGFQNGVLWHDIEVLPDNLGKPLLSLKGGALLRAKRLGARRFLVTISHEREMALAFVIMED